MPDATRQYAALTVLFAAALFVQAGNMFDLSRNLLAGNRVAAAPFALTPATRTIAGGRFAGDALLAMNGHPFNRARQLPELVRASRPGDLVSVTLSQPDGRAMERTISLNSVAAQRLGWSQVALTVALNLVIPLSAMGLGFTVVFIRPHDRNAWLLLFLMIGFTETVRNSSWAGPWPDLVFLWGAFWKSVWPIAMIFFGLYFPTRSMRDRRRPWVKYVALVVFLLIEFSYEGIFLLWQHDLNAAEAMRSTYTRLYFLQLTVLLLANGTFFRSLRIKSATETTSDARRRLSLLRWGSWLGLGPTILVFFYAFFTRSTAFSNVPWPITFPTLLLLALFPATLAYVIVVERAMDLRFVLRMGMQYGFARLGLWLARALLVAFAIYIFSKAATRAGMSFWEPVQLFGVGAALLFVRKQGADRASVWIDRKFFREAYDAERVLTGLASEVSRYLEVKPLIERVAGRIGETLHVEEIVILQSTGEKFRTEYSTRPGQPMDIPLTSRIAARLEKSGEPLAIYFDKPAPWIRSLDAEELQTLDFMRTQLLLPLMGRDQLIGIISLGPKRSEIPYSDTDMRLLQAVAAHTGMALDNSRLLASLAQEAAAREGANRELEIAREVQERLFPQSCPPIAGLECAGYCRTARGVGGDYYDFLALPDGKLGIAIGDVSGKGIGAALLMATLQASLRGQVISGRHDLAALMTNMNQLVFEASTDSRYATLLYAEYNPATRDLCYVNAGHNAPFVMRGDELIRLGTGGPVVGLLPDRKYEQAAVKMQPGDIFVAFTDGISEAMTESDEEWDEAGLIAAARESRTLSPEDMIQAIFQSADAFTGPARQNDDMTLVVIKLL